MDGTPNDERRSVQGAPFWDENLNNPSGIKSSPSLRPYQISIVEQVERAVADGARRVLMVLPTGAGKTVVAAEIVTRARGRDERIVFLAHRRELITQASAKLHTVGVDHGILQAGFSARPGEAVQVASVQTVHARAFRSARLAPPPADLIVVDEAHHAPAATYRRIVEHYPNAVILGLTATPCRGDGRGLGADFDVLVEGPSVEQLVRDGFLVPTKVFAPSRPDLDGVKITAGDYNEMALAERMNTRELVGDIVTHWLKLGERRRTVVFTTGVAHSVHVRDEFRRAGVCAEHIDGTTPAEERDSILRGLAAGDVEIVCNCMVLTEGWDAPSASCLILARPTKHMGLFRQMAGRVMRPFPGKTNAIVLDHSGAVFEHGFVEEPVEWTLSPDKRAVAPMQHRRAMYEAPKLCTCPECSAVYLQGRPCGSCGWRPRTKAQSFDVVDGDLGEVNRQRKVASSLTDKHAFLAQLTWLGRQRGYKPGWAAYKYKEKFGDWPARGIFVAPVEPDDTTLAWVRSRQIAYARAVEKHGAL